MKIFKKAVVPVLVALSISGAAFADDPAFHTLYDVEADDYQNGAWRFGYLIYNYIGLHQQSATYRYFDNFCWVRAPANASGVNTYGFSFNSSSTGHYGTGAVSSDGIGAPGAWTYTGEVEVEKTIKVNVKRLSDNARLYMDQLAFNWYFWYTAPGDPTQLPAGGAGSSAQQDKYSPDL